MTAEAVTSLIILLFGSLWTPGPNNAMLASSGATYGFARTIPHMMGVAFGFAFMLFLTGIGIGAVFEAFPVAEQIIRWAGVAMMLWVVWKIATARAPSEGDVGSKPFTFLQACAFQWVNPKAWAMCLAIISQFVTSEEAVIRALVAALIAGVMGVGSSFTWTSFGVVLRRFLQVPWRLRLFNFTMAGIILFGLIAILIS